MHALPLQKKRVNGLVWRGSCRSFKKALSSTSCCTTPRSHPQLPCFTTRQVSPRLMPPAGVAWRLLAAAQRTLRQRASVGSGEGVGSGSGSGGSGSSAARYIILCCCNADAVRAAVAAPRRVRV
jgi:hypothetical protein